MCDHVYHTDPYIGGRIYGEERTETSMLRVAEEVRCRLLVPEGQLGFSRSWVSFGKEFVLQFLVSRGSVLVGAPQWLGSLPGFFLLLAGEEAREGGPSLSFQTSDR